MAAVLWQFSFTQRNDINGKPIAGARAYFFDGGTTTPLASGPWQDIGLTSAHQNPVIADALGMFPAVFLDDTPGVYGLRITDADGVQILAADTLPYGGGGGDGDVIISGGDLTTGALVPSLDTGNVSGFVRANGRTIGNASSAATERAADNVQALFEKLWAKDVGAFEVIGGRGASALADWAANKQIYLPDFRGRTLFGANSMGAGNSGRLSLANIQTTGADQNTAGTGGAGPDVIGSHGGAETVALTEAQLAAHDHDFQTATAETTITGGVQSGGSAHSHEVFLPNGSPSGGAGHGSPDYSEANTVSFDTENDGAHTHTDNFAVATTLDLNIANAGSGEAHPNLPPFGIITWYIKL